jgi:hypothetical protein
MKRAAGTSLRGQGDTASCSSLGNILHSTCGARRMFSGRNRSRAAARSAGEYKFPHGVYPRNRIAGYIGSLFQSTQLCEDMKYPSKWNVAQHGENQRFWAAEDTAFPFRHHPEQARGLAIASERRGTLPPPIKHLLQFFPIWYLQIRAAFPCRVWSESVGNVG